MSEARKVVEVIEREWVVVGTPQRCECGHKHYPRKASDQPNLAPQMHICEDPSCDCRALRRIGDFR